MGQHSFQGLGGVGLPSSGGDALPIPQVPSEFRANRPTFVFQGKMSRGSAAPRGLGVWACRLQGVMSYPWPRSPVSFDRPTFIFGSASNLRFFSRFIGQLPHGPAVLCFPHHPQVPSEFRANRPTFVFQGKMSRGSAAPRGMGVWTCRLQGVMPYPWPRSPVSFERIGQPSFFSRYPVTAA